MDKNLPTSLRRLVILGCVMLGALPGLTLGQPYPARSINVIGNLGGTLDMPARVVFDRIKQNTGANAVIEQRPGANGALGLSPVKRAAPDGYTLAYTFASALTLNPLMTKSVDFQPRDFTPVTALVQLGPVIAARSDHRAATLKDLIELARQKPESVKIGYSGAGTHVNLLRIEQMTGVKFLLVPYRSNADAVAATLGGFIDAHVDTVATVVGQAGRLKALSYGASPRSARLPDVPSLREIVPGLDMVTWFGIVGPPGMPTEVVTWLHREISRALRDPQVADVLTKAGYEIVGNAPADLANLIREEAEANQTIATRYNLAN